MVALLVVAALWFTAVRPRPALPTYHGKTAQEWFFGEDGHPGREETMKAARVAFEAMGTNCAPLFLETLRRRDNAFNRFYCWAYPKFPSMLQSGLRQPSRIPYVQMIALTHLRHLDRRLDSMAGDFMAIMPSLSDNNTRRQAYDAIELLAVRLDDVAKKKAYFLSFFDDSDFHIQLESAIMLSRIDSSVTNGIPILVNALTNQSLMNSNFPTPSLPGLGNQVLFRQHAAFEALQKIAPSLADRYRVAD